MRKKQKRFPRIWKEVVDECLEKYGIVVANNAKFISENIFRQAANKSYFSYAECGVYKGTTFFPIYHFCKKMFKDFKLYALDSFSGFPDEVLLNENDEFVKFEKLHKEGRITKDHLDMARERCKKLPIKIHRFSSYHSVTMRL